MNDLNNMTTCHSSLVSVYKESTGSHVAQSIPFEVPFQHIFMTYQTGVHSEHKVV